MKQKKEVTVREFIHALNIREEDVDVCVDGIDCIAMCGGEIAITPAGLEEFGAVLDMKMDGCCIIGDDKDYEDLDNDEGKLVLAWDFVKALAGYCPCDDFDKWFEGPDAEII